MTTLVVDELKTTLTQEVTLNLTPRQHLAAVRPHLYVHNNPAGTFTFAVLNAADAVLTSDTFTSADVYTALGTSDDYAHAYFTISFEYRHLPPGTYKLRLSSSGYTFSESAYLGWVRDHEDLIVPLDYTPSDDSENPLSYQVWVRR